MPPFFKGNFLRKVSPGKAPLEHPGRFFVHEPEDFSPGVARYLRREFLWRELAFEGPFEGISLVAAAYEEDDLPSVIYDGGC